MRSSAIIHGVPITTTIAGFAATLEGLEDFTRFGDKVNQDQYGAYL